jgi:hypothetical protein
MSQTVLTWLYGLVTVLGFAWIVFGILAVLYVHRESIFVGAYWLLRAALSLTAVGLVVGAFYLLGPLLFALSIIIVLLAIIAYKLPARVRTGPHSPGIAPYD